MVRVVLTEVGLFLLPFGIFAVLLLLQRRRILADESWSRHALLLAIAGFLIVIGGFVYEGLVVERPMSGFEPTHMENGQVVPGRFR